MPDIDDESSDLHLGRARSLGRTAGGSLGLLAPAIALITMLIPSCA